MYGFMISTLILLVFAVKVMNLSDVFVKFLFDQAPKGKPTDGRAALKLT